MQPSPHDAAMQGPMPFIRRLVLADFRSYAASISRLQPGLVVLTGENGAGKTNLIEADFLPLPGPRVAPRRAQRMRARRRSGPLVRLRRACNGLWAPAARDRHGEPARRHGAAPLSPRPRADHFAQAFRRSHPHHLADAIHGRALFRPRRRAAPFSRPPRARRRCRAGDTSQCARTRAAQSQSPARRKCRPALARCRRT